MEKMVLVSEGNTAADKTSSKHTPGLGSSSKGQGFAKPTRELVAPKHPRFSDGQAGVTAVTEQLILLSLSKTQPPTSLVTDHRRKFKPQKQAKPWRDLLCSCNRVL